MDKINENKFIKTDCPRCSAFVGAEVLSQYQCEPIYDDAYEIIPLYTFALCPLCKHPLLCESEYAYAGEEMQYDVEGNECGELPYYQTTKIQRVWPESQFVHMSIPNIVRMSLIEAQKCYNVKAFSACAVMCGKAIEGICVSEVNKSHLQTGLKKLSELGIIDNRLYEWGEALRKERNIGAHAAEEDTKEQDAKDVIDFILAICEYIYVLSPKYDAYKKRKKIS